MHKRMYPARSKVAKLCESSTVSPPRFNSALNANTDECIRVEDPKDGNDSIAKECRDNYDNKRNNMQKLSKSVGPAMAYMRAQAHKLSREQSLKMEYNSQQKLSSSDDDDDYAIPWRLIPSNIIEELEFFKNADQKLQDDIQRTTQLVFVEKPGRGMVPKLKDPICFFSKEYGPHQTARWPADIQVIDKQIKHIPYVPKEPEPFYVASGSEKMPMVHGEGFCGRLVYMYEPRSTFFVRSRAGGIRTGPEQCAVSLNHSIDDTTLVFESRFESGNLLKAIQVGEYEYELWLRYDLYTSKHTQWFYFSVSNTRPNVVYRFSIVNFMKPDSLYSCGMKPLFYSEMEALQKKIGWRRCGSGIIYYKNNLKYETSKGEKPFYSLTWTCEFPYNNDTVYFSHCYPYTYTDLQDYLLELSNDPAKSKICKQRVLCRTLAGNYVYLLTITSACANPEDMKHKKAIVLTSRVHPGESNASWMMKGFLDYLTGNSADSKLLRDTFIFKIVPMLNPDGVIVGNYRCSLAGRDLNRNYKTLLKNAYPPVWHTKQMIRRLLSECEIVVYCDLHGHSRKHNVFIYGCENRRNPKQRLQEQVFPCMLHKNSPDKFNFESCKFKIQKSKEGTGRVVMWNMGIPNSYTIEASFCGSTMGNKNGFHFNTQDFEQIGQDFCDTLLDYCDPDTTKCAKVLCDLEEDLKYKIQLKLQQSGVNVDNMDVLSDEMLAFELESSDDGSDSSVSDGPPLHLHFQKQRVTKNKNLKTKKETNKLRAKQYNDKELANQHRPLSGYQSCHSKQDKIRKLLELSKCDADDTQAIAMSLKSNNSALSTSTHLNGSMEVLTNANLQKGIMQNQQDQERQPVCTIKTLALVPALSLYNHDLGLGLNIDDTIRQCSSSSSLCTQTDRQISRHMHELSEAQRRHHELQQQLKGKKLFQERMSLMTHLEDEKLGGQSTRLRTQASCTTYVEYNALKISQLHIEDWKAENTVKNDTTNEQGMHDSDEEVEYVSKHDALPDYLQYSCSHGLHQVKSSKVNGEKMNSTIQSIKNLRKTLASAAASSNLSPMAENYIEKLLKNELNKTNADIDKITSHMIQINIDDKQKQYEEILHKVSSRDSAIAATSNTVHSLPVSSVKDRGSSSGKTGKTELMASVPVARNQKLEENNENNDTNNGVPRKNTCVRNQKLDGRNESKDSNSGQKQNHFTTNLNGNAAENVTGNIKLVDVYRISDTNHLVGTKQNELQKEEQVYDTDTSGYLKSMKKYSELESVLNGNSGLLYGSVVDLSEPQFCHSTSEAIKSSKKNTYAQGIVAFPCSTSNNNSMDDIWIGDKVTERDKNETVTKVKSGKGNVRQVVETIPTKICLMITQEHEETKKPNGQFLPMSRTVRRTFSKSAQQQPRRK